MKMKKEECLGDIDYPLFHKRLDETVFIVHECLDSMSSYRKLFTELYNYMKQGFEKPEVRKHPLKYKFTNADAEQVKTMEIRHFIVNIIFWSAFIKLDKVEELNSSHIFDCNAITEDSMSEYINNKIIIPYRTCVESVEINRAIDDVVYTLSQIDTDFSLIMATTMDMETFIELRQKYPRFGELLNTKPEPGMQPKEIEDMLAGRLKEYCDIVINDEDNNLKPFLVTGVGINRGQLSQFSIMGGLKPDIEGNVITKPIDSNFINGGLNSISNFYIDGQAGCKPLIMNKTVMGKSGHFSYKTMTLASNYRISQTVDDCHSSRPINFEVTSQKRLNKIDGRYYVGDDGKLHNINAKKDHHLVGKTILLRDPTTCTAPDGICHKCYGDVYYTNNDPTFNAGRYAATQVNNPIQQKILSSKHMLKTNSNMLEFSNDFYRFFELDSNKIRFNMNSEEDFSHWILMIHEDDYFVIDDMEEGDFNYYTEKIYLRNKKTEEEVEIYELANHDLFLYGQVANKIKQLDKNTVGVSLSKLNIDNPIAIINIVNNELSKPLKNIMKLLDRKDHFDCHTIDDMVNKICQLTIDSGMDVMTVHCSMLIKGLIRSKDNILLPPDFSNPDTCENYQILTVSNALLYNPSLAVSISFENLNRQILNPLTYRKYKPSDYDIFYKEELYADSKRYKVNKKRLKKRLLAQKKK